MNSRPAHWTAAENDYRGIQELAATDAPSIAVVIPVFNRTRSLLRTLSGLAEQSHGTFETIVADDGSTDDVAGAVANLAPNLDVRVLSQDHDGFGAGRARNMGAAASEADVVVFIDADCVPHRDLIKHHLFWHQRAANVVVAGTRINHEDGDESTPAPGWDGLEQAPGRMPADWRRLIYRRSKLLTIGDDGYRAGVSSNLSVRRDRLEAVGGFSDVFRTWGGEDTELSWRLWNSGMFVVPENRAIVYHQRDEDELGDTGRAEARRRAVELMADRVPHRFYRKVPSPFYTVPKVSWIARARDIGEVDRLWRELSLATFPDAELVLLASSSAIDHLTTQAANSPRLALVDAAAGFEAALAATQGELVALIDGRARIDRRLLSRAVARLERDPRASAVRCSYRLSGNRQFRRLDDISSLDSKYGTDGFPFFGLVRRRELLKDPDLLGTPGDAWRAALARSRTELLINDHATLGLDESTEPRIPGPGDLFAAGPRELGRLGVRAARSIRRRSRPEEASPPPVRRLEKVRVDYIGFTGKDNLGDEAVLAGVRKLLPWAEIGRDIDDPEVLMVGGGTLINGKNYYLTRVLRNDSPRLEKVVFGTGVRNPGFWGVTEEMAEWWSVLSSSVYAGVRGPDSVDNLRKLGYQGRPDILGDPALSLTAPEDSTRVTGRVIICPVHTAGSLWGGDDEKVFAALASSIRQLRGRGHEVVMMSLFPADDRWLIELMRAAGASDMPYVPGYSNLDATLGWLASADLVVSERLHGSILAAACGTPFVALEYRPKVRDFARSIQMERLLVKTDEIERLDETIATVLSEGDDLRRQINEAVDQIRTHQDSVAARLRLDLESALR